MIFSYYMGGMNFIDMMKLKWDNIQGDRILYIRSKTKGRFTVKMAEPVKKLISYYQSQKRPTGYVFPILLKENLTPMQVENRKHNYFIHDYSIQKDVFDYDKNLLRNLVL